MKKIKMPAIPVIKDRNGREISPGDRAVILSDPDLRGRIGFVSYFPYGDEVCVTAKLVKKPSNVKKCGGWFVFCEPNDLSTYSED